MYRAAGGRAGLLREAPAGADGDDGGLTGSRLAERSPAADPRDYDVDFYLAQLHDTYAARLVRAFSPDDFARVFADPQQLNLFPSQLSEVRPILTILSS